MYQAKIIGTGSYLPEKKMTNHDLEKLVDTSDEWIRTRTGILERRIADKEESTSDLAVKAAEKAMDTASVKPSEIDLLILATATPDSPFPSTACIVQAKLGLGNAGAFDISATCSGFIYGLSIAEQYIKNGRYNKILLVCAEVYSRIIDWSNRNTCILFGDGAAAVVLTKTDEKNKGILSTHLHSFGEFAEHLTIPAGGSKIPMSSKAIESGLHYLKMNGNKIFKMAINKMCQASMEALEFNSLTINDIDLFIPHQANKRIIDGVASSFGLEPDKTAINVDKYGNTSAATIPIAMDEALQENRIRDGNIILLAAFGGGLTWGSALIRW